MALVRVAQYSSTPTVVGDYQAQNAHLQAFTNQLMTQQFILDAGTAQPVIKQGCYVSHGGSLYVADADTAITGSPSDGSVYIRVSGTTSLTVEFVTDISGYAWNPVHTALTSGSYTLLPYLIVKASTVWTRYNFNPNNQQFGSLASLTVIGNSTVGGTLGVTGAISGASIDASIIPRMSLSYSFSLSQGQTYLFPAGLYIIFELTGGFLEFSRDAGSTWISGGGSIPGFTFITDGSMVRWTQNTTPAKTIYYVKF